MQTPRAGALKPPGRLLEAAHGLEDGWAGVTMRLICPNCGAQYEVDPDVIPDTGRDVQCSNCGHGWFQKPPEVDADLAAEMGQTLRQDIAEASPPPPEPEPAPRAETGDDARPEADAAPREPRARRLDPELADVLREEAAREAAARRAEAESLETQPDLGLEDGGAAAPRPVSPRERAARMKDAAASRASPDDPGSGAETEDEDDAQPPRRGARSELLPDIDEINSTLRPSDAPDRAEDAAPAASAPIPAADRRRRGARRGFLLVVLVTVLAVCAYYFAPEIVRTVPASAPYLDAYVSWVNDVRPQINQGVEDGFMWIQDLIGSLTGNGGAADGG